MARKNMRKVDVAKKKRTVQLYVDLFSGIFFGFVMGLIVGMMLEEADYNGTEVIDMGEGSRFETVAHTGE